ncbi:hypothetical protein BKA70DRAFT_1255277 [Coprinopsis sp. MPI-PUGE-AT-0042]|nr:hypothetical protein BKA70DRAFT_1255277 [Coprinopsis sp. MPI-PUGE-AT-0042]
MLKSSTRTRALQLLVIVVKSSEVSYWTNGPLTPICPIEESHVNFGTISSPMCLETTVQGPLSQVEELVRMYVCQKIIKLKGFMNGKQGGLEGRLWGCLVCVAGGTRLARPSATKTT